MSEDVIRRCDFRIKERNKYRTCNERIANDAPTIFSFDETFYSVDLCTDCKLRAVDSATIAELIEIARPEYAKVGGEVRRLIRNRSGDITTAKVRAWARENGYDPADTGAI